MTEDFDVPEGTVFRDLTGLTDDEVAACFSLDIRELPPEEKEALREAVVNLDRINAWLLEVTGEPGHILPGPALTRSQMREQGLICREPHGCNGFTTAEDD